MRIMRMLSVVALAVLPVAASAQQQSTPPAPAAPVTAQQTDGAPLPPAAPAPQAMQQNAATDVVGTITRGELDLGIRGTNLKGDYARFEQYRDMGNGLFFDRARFHSERAGWFVDLGGNHLGRTDQEFDALVNKAGTFKGWASWNQTPLYLSDTDADDLPGSEPGRAEDCRPDPGRAPEQDDDDG